MAASIRRPMMMTAITSLLLVPTSLSDVCLFLAFFRPNTTDPGTDTIDKLLGQGTFGKVVEAWDKRKQTKCAVKIIRSVQKYRDASRIELRVLSTLSLNDKTNRNKCIHLRDSFDYRNHICIVTDLLGQSVFDFLKGNSFVPFPSTQIQNFARQLFTSVACGY
jgi:dual-specificity kinase